MSELSVTTEDRKKLDELVTQLMTSVESNLVPTAVAEEELQSFLSTLARLQTSLATGEGLEYASYHELILREGKFFAPAKRPTKYRKLPNKQCFSNSYYTSVSTGLPYVEGYAVSSVGVPVHHAWNLNEDGSVLDTTWNDGTAYAGIEFAPQEATTIVLAKGTYGVLDDFSNRHPALHKKFSKESLIEFYQSKNFS